MGIDERDQAAEGLAILHRLVPAPERGPGYRRDPETGFVFYSAAWLDDEVPSATVLRLRLATRK